MDYIKLPHNHGEGEQNSIHEQMSKVTNFQVVADIFKQLGDPTRIRIFWLLCHCEECVINISAMMNMSSPAVSHHLRPLKKQRSDCKPPRRKRGLLPRRRHAAKPASASYDRAGNGNRLPREVKRGKK